jgi:hypothetical protein
MRCFALALALAAALGCFAFAGDNPEKKKLQVSLYGTGYRDADVQALAKTHPGLQSLQLGWPGMTDSALSEAGKLASLEELHLNNITSGGREVVITAGGWRALDGLPKLRELSVNDVKLNEAALKEIGQFRQIKSLYLAHNGVTDAGVKHLEGMTQLTKLGLLQSAVSDASGPGHHEDAEPGDAADRSNQDHRRGVEAVRQAAQAARLGYPRRRCRAGGHSRPDRVPQPQGLDRAPAAGAGGSPGVAARSQPRADDLADGCKRAPSAVTELAERIACY